MSDLLQRFAQATDELREAEQTAREAAKRQYHDAVLRHVLGKELPDDTELLVRLSAQLGYSQEWLQQKIKVAKEIVEKLKLHRLRDERQAVWNQAADERPVVEKECKERLDEMMRRYRQAKWEHSEAVSASNELVHLARHHKYFFGDASDATSLRVKECLPAVAKSKPRPAKRMTVEDHLEKIRQTVSGETEDGNEVVAAD